MLCGLPSLSIASLHLRASCNNLQHPCNYLQGSNYDTMKQNWENYCKLLPLALSICIIH
ncbi:hypothetical protein CHLRE_16g661638v5 [Chlamydomonas reinhardtii]|uniref:Uncharacterized protein n=1 Tax=Chlamydomonas reinhardtii TaxID=3055 RepID=A0A2K3CTJ9_CHLRE|nr:uncharacterized protein CHLRE_16g661638v5 [Chlamydomonas reinhardtii]PNW71614.1 hypothetical protein CHLRE_16g661638v5 [Chlamydomonas reinhardtii]